MNIPRLLPLIGVALVGVLAVNALAGARDLPQMLSAARAYAEGAAAPEPKGKKDKAGKAADISKPEAEATAAPATPPGPAPAPAAVCAPGAADLAKAAGLSPAELSILQNLQARRTQIDAQSKDLDTQTQLLTAAEAKLDAKFKAMADLKAQIEALMGQADQKTQGEVDRLTVVYSKMPSKKAAPIMATLDDKVRVPVAAAMKPAILAAILKDMDPPDAKKLTELLARRFAPVQQLADAARNPPPAAAAPAPPAKPGDKAAAAKPSKAKTDQAAAEPGDANVDEKPAPKAKAKPKQIAKRAPPRKKPAAKAPAKKPVEEAKAPAGPRPYSEVKDAASPKPPAATPAAAPPAKT